MRKHKDFRWAILAAFSTLVSLPAPAAPGTQTAEGAQKFLATMAGKVATRVHFVDAAGRTNYVTGKHTGEVKTVKGSALGKAKETNVAMPETFVEKQVSEIHAVTLEAIDAQGRPNACATRITAVTAAP